MRNHRGGTNYFLVNLSGAYGGFGTFESSVAVVACSAAIDDDTILVPMHAAPSACLLDRTAAKHTSLLLQKTHCSRARAALHAVRSDMPSHSAVRFSSPLPLMLP